MRNADPITLRAVDPAAIMEIGRELGVAYTIAYNDVPVTPSNVVTIVIMN